MPLLYTGGATDLIDATDPINRLHPLASGLAAAFVAPQGYAGGSKFPNLFRLGDASQHGTLTGGPTWSTGSFGAHLNFDGTDDYLKTGAATSPSLRPSAFPIALGCAFRVNSLSVARPLISLGGNASIDAHTGCLLLIQTTGAISIQAGYGGPSGPAVRRNLETAAGAVIVGDWYTVLAVMDTATTGKIWVNGVSHALATSGTGSGNISYTGYDGFWIGRYGRAGNPALLHHSGQIAAAFAWTGRTFEQQSASDFAADPFCMLRRIRPWSLGTGETGGSGSTTTTTTGSTGLVDWTCPVNVLHPSHQSRRWWWRCLAGISGGRRLPNLALPAEGYDHLTVSPTVSASPSWFGGSLFPADPDGSFLFDGVNDRLSLAIPAYRQWWHQTATTYAVTVCPGTNAATAVVFSVDRGSNGTCIYRTTGGLWGVKNSVETASIETTTATPDGQTVRLMYTTTAAGVGTLYVNGVAQVSGTVALIANNMQNIMVGAKGASGVGTQFFAGRVSDVQVWIHYGSNAPAKAEFAAADYAEAVLGCPTSLRRVRQWSQRIESSAPTYTASASLIPARAVFGGSASFTPPVYTGSISNSGPTPDFSASAVNTNPVWTGSLSKSGPTPDFVGTAQNTNPVYTGSVSNSGPTPDFASAAQNTNPVWTGSLSKSGPTPDFTAAVVNTNPIWTGSLAKVGPTPDFTATGLFAASVSAGSLAATGPTADFLSLATNTNPVYTGSGAFTFGAVDFTAAASNVNPIWTAAASLTGPAASITAAAVNTNPMWIATAELTGPVVSFLATATFAILEGGPVYGTVGFVIAVTSIVGITPSVTGTAGLEGSVTASGGLE